jgi:hypothetical protein
MYELLQQAYGENAMGRAQVFDWFSRFKEGRTSFESDTLSGSKTKVMFSHGSVKITVDFKIKVHVTGDF